ncbi:B12 binding protein [Tepidimonas ignava]|uniref:B12 binding protein n=1 Tax=Tepidimonas ignava TaxID=114249 RepID=A0A4R3L6A9_9BURK|nr:cobalamin B12-binding domain-containing protein [Tepidimonas ignava]TCS95401.1 B12 binding protein [Tepidimonas ignava]TSE20014.1 HTH-type transcriptional repressor CarH [Tepidimonas ignava]
MSEQQPSDASSTDQAPTWTIADVERDTGIGKDTLRVWERRYGFPRPGRDAHGDRCYDTAQVQRLRLIRRLLDLGHRPGRVVGLPLTALQDLAARGPRVAPSTAPTPPHAQATVLAQWLGWLEADQGERVQQALRASLQQHGLAQTVQTLVAPMCVAVGEAWAQGRLGVYQEHLWTEVVQRTLREAIAALDAAPGTPKQAPRVLLTTTPGEPHLLGLLMAECFLALQGCERVVLGAQTPLIDIVTAARRLAVDVVGLSYSAYVGRRDLVDELVQLRTRLPDNVALWVGGAGAQRHGRALPPGVDVVAQAGDVARRVHAWRARHRAA